MAKSGRGRRRSVSRDCRPTPYPMVRCGQNVNVNVNGNQSSIKDWEDVTCSVCMEYPHNAVLLLCSSHEKGCRPYMCGTGSRYSNCLHQYKNAYTKLTSPHTHPLQGTPGLDQISGWPVDKCGEGAELACPLCRGQVKGWTVVESAREYLNAKKRTCMHDNCCFFGGYKELKKHVRLEHALANKPREVDPDQEQKWRRLEQESERDDVISTITSSMPGSVVFGDYVIERNNTHSDDDEEEEEGFDMNGLGGNNSGGLDVGMNSNLVNVLLLFHAFGPGGNTGWMRRRGDGDGDDDDGGGGGDDDDDGDNGMSLVDRLLLLGRTGRRRRQQR